MRRPTLVIKRSFKSFNDLLGPEDHLHSQVIKYLAYHYPDLVVVHSPLEGKRSKFERFKLKVLGTRRGVSDLIILRARKKYHGLCLELKVNNNKPTKHQLEFLQDCANEGYLAMWVNTFDDAVAVLDDYLTG